MSCDFVGFSRRNFSKELKYSDFSSRTIHPVTNNTRARVEYIDRQSVDSVTTTVTRLRNPRFTNIASILTFFLVMESLDIRLGNEGGRELYASVVAFRRATGFCHSGRGGS